MIKNSLAVALAGLFVFQAGAEEAVRQKETGMAGTNAVHSEQGDQTVKQLPAPKLTGSMSVEECIAKRRSVREFSDEPLTDEMLGQLLWSAQGVTDARRGLRAAPSAGATYPLETYLVTRDGFFHYLPDRHALEKLASGDLRQALAGAALGQPCVRRAAAVVVFAAVPDRTTARYGKRGIMYIHMEAGHAAENVHLQAVALGLGSVAVGAFDEGQAGKALGIPDTQTLLYLIPVGHPAK